MRRFAPGESVVRAGEISSALYLIATGAAVVKQDGREIGSLQTGDFFGETAFLSGVPRVATVRARNSGPGGRLSRGMCVRRLDLALSWRP